MILNINEQKKNKEKKTNKIEATPNDHSIQDIRISPQESHVAGSLVPAAEEASSLERDTVLTICLTALLKSH